MHMTVDAITQVKVPLPFPLKWTNGYLIRGNDGYTIIDPGLHTADTEKVWKTQLQHQGIRFTDVKQIVLTHHHPDHYGLAGWLQLQTGAPVRMSKLGFEQAQQLWGGDQSLSEEIIRLFAHHGMPQGMSMAMKRHLESFIAYVSPHPLQPHFLQLGESITMGDHNYRIIESHGHAYGHLSFYDEQRQMIFCGDQVLPRISPNISLIPGSDTNPLASFLRSLHELSELPVREAHPGHREPFTDFSARCLQLLAHHEERLTQIRQHLRTAATGYDICMQLFGDQLSIHQFRFALAETLAHLEYMREEGWVTLKEHDEGKLLYECI